MSMGFVSTAKRGQHFDLATLAMKKLKSANLALKGKSEREFKQAVIGHLKLFFPTLQKI